MSWSLPLYDCFFWLFATFLVGASVAVICFRNPVHAVLSLIICFFNAAGLFILLQAEFIAMILVIVYVGAVAVLFLFVVMMLNVKAERQRLSPKMRFLVVILGAELGIALFSSLQATHSLPLTITQPIGTLQNIGAVLYTDYIFAFQAAGIILLVAMIGAIVLTLRHRPVRRQDISRQLARTKHETLSLKKVPIGEGIG